MKNSPATLEKRQALQRKWKAETDPCSFPHFVEKRCKECGEIKLCSWNSSFSSTGAPQYKARCVECHRTWMNSHRRDDVYRIKRNMRRLEQNRILKKKAVAYLGGKCEKCGYTGVALTFHHKDPEEKEFTFGSFVDKPWAKVVKELDKCQLLCFNCHMEIHWEEAGSESV